MLARAFNVLRNHSKLRPILCAVTRSDHTYSHEQYFDVAKRTHDEWPKCTKERICCYLSKHSYQEVDLNKLFDDKTNQSKIRQEDSQADSQYERSIRNLAIYMTVAKMKNAFVNYGNKIVILKMNSPDMEGLDEQESIYDYQKQDLDQQEELRVEITKAEANLHESKMFKREEFEKLERKLPDDPKYQEDLEHLSIIQEFEKKAEEDLSEYKDLLEIYYSDKPLYLARILLYDLIRVSGLSIGLRGSMSLNYANIVGPASDLFSKGWSGAVELGNLRKNLKEVMADFIQFKIPLKVYDDDGAYRVNEGSNVVSDEIDSWSIILNKTTAFFVSFPPAFESTLAKRMRMKQRAGSEKKEERRSVNVRDLFIGNNRVGRLTKLYWSAPGMVVQEEKDGPISKEFAELKDEDKLGVHAIEVFVEELEKARDDVEIYEKINKTDS